MDNQSNRFKSSNKLLLATDYKNVFQQSVRATDKYFTVLACTNQKSQARLGLAISKKNTRRAVDRNKLKRLARESFRNHKSELTGLDLVVMAKYDAANVKNSILINSLSTHWNKLSHKFSMKSK